MKRWVGLLTAILTLLVMAWPASGLAADCVTNNAGTTYTLDTLDTAFGNSIDKVGNTYTFHCALTLRLNDTLNVAAGSTIKVDPAKSFNILGKLNVNGTAGSPVTFMSSAASPGHLAWDGIRVQSGNGTSSLVMTYGRVLNAKIDGINIAPSSRVNVLSITHSYLYETDLLAQYVNGLVLDSTTVTEATGNTVTVVNLDGSSLSSVTGNYFNTQATNCIDNLQPLYVQALSGNSLNCNSTNRVELDYTGTAPVASTCASAVSQGYINITTTRTWTQRATFVFSRDLCVRDTGSLTINAPGAELWFGSTIYLESLGDLSISGSAGSKLVLRSTTSTSTAFTGLYIKGGASDSLYLSNTTFYKADTVTSYGTATERVGIADIRYSNFIDSPVHILKSNAVSVVANTFTAPSGNASYRPLDFDNSTSLLTDLSVLLSVSDNTFNGSTDNNYEIYHVYPTYLHTLHGNNFNNTYVDGVLVPDGIADVYVEENSLAAAAPITTAVQWSQADAVFQIVRPATINRELRINSGGSVTINGTRSKYMFMDSYLTNLTINGTGSLVIDGTTLGEIEITNDNPDPLYGWFAIDSTFTTGSNFSLDHAYFHSGQLFLSGTSSISRLDHMHVTNSDFLEVYFDLNHVGDIVFDGNSVSLAADTIVGRLAFQGTCDVTSFANNVFRGSAIDNDYILYQYPGAFLPVLSGNAFTGASDAQVLVYDDSGSTRSITGSGTVTQAATTFWVDQNLTFSGGSLIITGPGSSYKFSNTYGISGNGSFSASGAAGNNLVMQAYSGTWTGLTLTGGTGHTFGLHYVTWANAPISIGGSARLTTADVDNSTITSSLLSLLKTDNVYFDTVTLTGDTNGTPLTLTDSTVRLFGSNIITGRGTVAYLVNNYPPQSIGWVNNNTLTGGTNKFYVNTDLVSVPCADDVQTGSQPSTTFVIGDTICVGPTGSMNISGDNSPWTFENNKGIYVNGGGLTFSRASSNWSFAGAGGISILNGTANLTAPTSTWTFAGTGGIAVTGGSLTAAANGSTWTFPAANGITVNDGNFAAGGSSGQLLVLQGPAGGAWAGISDTNGNAKTFQLAYVNVKPSTISIIGGANNLTSANISSSTLTSAPVTINNSNSTVFNLNTVTALSGAAWVALDLSGTTVGSITSNAFTANGNDYVIKNLGTKYIGVLSLNTFSGATNVANVLAYSSTLNCIGSPQTWSQVASFNITSNVCIGAAGSVTITALNNHYKFGSSAGFTGQGSLISTPANPNNVWFEPISSSWNGIDISILAGKTVDLSRTNVTNGPILVHQTAPGGSGRAAIASGLLNGVKVELSYLGSAAFSGNTVTAVSGATVPLLKVEGSVIAAGDSIYNNRFNGSAASSYTIYNIAPAYLGRVRSNTFSGGGSVADIRLYSVANPALTGTNNWTQSASYRVASNINLASGALAITPVNTTWKFDTGLGITIGASAALTVIGSSGNPITFTSSAPVPAKGDWTGINLGSGASFSAAYLRLWYPTSGVIAASPSAFVFDHGEIDHFSGYGLDVTTMPAGGRVTYNYINGAESTSPAVRLTGGSGKFLNNTILSNTARTIDLGTAAAPNFGDGNSLGNNQLLHLDTGAYDFYNGSASNINARGNYWGSTVVDVINALIYDKTDNAAMGTVIYDGYTASTYFTALSVNKANLYLGDTVRISFTVASAPTGRPDVTIAGVAATWLSGNTTTPNYVYRYTARGISPEVHGMNNIVVHALDATGVHKIRITQVRIVFDRDYDGLCDVATADGNTAFCVQTEGAYGASLTDPDSDDDGLCDGIKTVGVTCVAGEVGVYNTNPILSDTDSDGMPDKYETDRIACGLLPTVSDPNGDWDADSLGNLLEYTTGASPCLADTDGDSMKDGWEYTNRACVNILVGDSLLNGDTDTINNKTEFSVLSNPCSSDTDGDRMKDGWEYTYRACVNILVGDSLLNGDTDTLQNRTEHTLGSNPCSSDTDGDHMSDTYENGKACLNILVGDSLADGDTDTLTNIQEKTLGSNPCSNDTDGDGMRDGWENTYKACVNILVGDSLLNGDTDTINNKTEFSVLSNPCSSDTDGDRMKDGWEYTYRACVNILVGDSLLNGDTDTLQNRTEHTLNSNPCSADTDGDQMKDDWENTHQTCVNLLVADGLANGDTDTLDNVTEFSVLSNPCSSDSDSDGMPDGWEYTYRSCLNINANDAATDTDVDFLTNMNELVNVTDPCNKDSDDGGEWDGIEINNARDPLFAGDDYPMVQVGAGTGAWDLPLASAFHDARTQIIYTPADFGRGGSIGWLALDVATIPGQTLFNYTIRMKHVTTGSYPDIKLVPTQVGTETDWTKINAGGSHSCAIKSDNTLYCWGLNTQGQLGNGGNVETATPTRVKDSLGLLYYSDWTAVSGGDLHTCGFRADGSLYCWGYGYYGQLGDNGSTNVALPKLLLTISGVSSVSAGANHTCAISSTNLYCWGLNGDGQLGDGSTATRRLPALIGTGYASVSAFGNHTCAIKTNNSLWCWGDNAYGEVGNGAYGADVPSPTQIAAAQSWSELALGSYHSCAVETGGSLYCWGYNVYGQLGINNVLTRKTTPTLVSSGWTKPTAGGAHSCAISTADNSLYCWGSNGLGQLGNGNVGDQALVPTLVNGGLAWSQAKSGNYHSCAINSANNSLYCWGNNQSSQVGVTKAKVGWDNTGWTTVYSNPTGEIINATGWRIFNFSTPFIFNGSSNLMVDISFDNTRATTSGLVRYTPKPGSAHSIYYRSNSANGNPLTWSNLVPWPSYSTYVPNILVQFPPTGTGDPDADGLTNDEEALYGTNPSNPDTDADGLCDGNTIVVGVCAAGEVFGYNTDPLDPDTDNDGLCDGNATVDGICVAGEVGGFGTNPLKADTDDDTMPDKYETDRLACGLLPTVSDPNGDWDADGLGNLLEYQQTSSPCLADTDGDSMKDGWEYTNRACVNLLVGDSLADGDTDTLNNKLEYTLTSNPCNKDSDGDTMRDGWEYANRACGVNLIVADPSSDPDADTLTNLVEYGLTSNPCSNDTDSDGMRDGWENTYKACVNILVGDSLLNGDTDTLNNKTEFGLLSNPCSSDTDGDHMNDTYENANVCLNILVGDSLADGDTDTLTNIQEKNLASNPCSKDSDGDTMRDGWEYTYRTCGINLIVNDGAADGDTDTLTNLVEYGLNSNPCSKDSDGDGMRDGWEYTYRTCGLNLIVNDGALDGDTDTLTNLVEYGLASNPCSKDSDGDTMRDGWEYTYRTCGLNLIVNDGAQDGDTDTLTNLVEYGLASNPCSKDSDGDTMRDGWEYTYRTCGLNLIVNDGAQDGDTDTLTNLVEYGLNSNPCSKDTDGDGMRDGWENTYKACVNILVGDSLLNGDTDTINNKTEFSVLSNPCSSDTDGDRMKDGWEYTYRSCVNILVGDSLLNGDTDTLQNRTEHTLNSNPCSADTDGDQMKDDWENTHQTCVNLLVADGLANGDTDTLDNVTEFSVLSNPCSSDSDSDGMPDGWEYTYRSCLNINSADAAADADRDFLSNINEFYEVTDPCDQDSDNGGEWDGMEVSGARNPLVAGDDFPMAQDGTDTTTWSYPYFTSNDDARTQTIYTAAELGHSGDIGWLALDDVTLPGKAMTAFTIRMKHTTLSDYPEAFKTSPFQVGTDTTWTKISGDAYHTCGIKSDNTLWCWGLNTRGQLGNNSLVESGVPVQVKDEAGTGYWTDWTSVTTGEQHSCATRSSGDLYCWGYGLYGQLGDNGSGNVYLPKKVSSLANVTAVSAGTNHTCAIVGNSTLYCWGINTDGQLGLNNTTTTRVPAAVYGSHTLFSKLSVSGGHSCAIKTPANTLWCWGDNAYGEVGNGAYGADVLIPTQIAAAQSWSELALGSYHSCAVDTGGSLYCWGYNVYGQLGINNTLTRKTIPTLVSSGWTKPTAGSAHSCAISSADNSLYCWGSNSTGQLGKGNAGDQALVPTLVNGGLAWSQADAGSNHSCAINSANNSLYCWGSNSFSQLGYNRAAWDNTGWTTVFSGTVTVSATGWRTFNFSTPFIYNGTDNLIVDISFNNVGAAATNGTVHATLRPAPRTLTYASNSANGDPLTWNGISPAPAVNNWTPNILVQFFPSGSVDPDGDGLTNAQEAVCGTNINNPDTDGDGLNDKLECVDFPCHNALSADTDSDGLCDGNVTKAGTCVSGEDLDLDGVLDANETNPCSADTDGDAHGDNADCDPRNSHTWDTCVTCVDGDADTWYGVCNDYTGINGPECDDFNLAIHPGATEICNGIDDNCVGGIDEGVRLTFYRDADTDTYGLLSGTTLACTAPIGYVSNSTDCNDGNSAVHPGATEVCNGIDDNCIGGIDEGVKLTFYRDADTDTYGLLSGTTLACTVPGGYVTNSTDCNDSNAAIKPGAVEIPGDQIDQNCNGSEICYVDVDNDNYRPDAVSTVVSADVDCIDSGEALATDPTTDCNDANAAVHPGATETCNGIDDNCIGGIDEGVKLTFYRDADIDTYGLLSGTTLACSVPGGYVTNSTDCNDGNAAVHPGAVETCNGIDDNCVGGIDEGVKLTFYIDADTDTYGLLSGTTLACTAPGGYVSNSTDCNDGNSAVHPLASEIPGDQIDQNCDGAEICYVDADNDNYRPDAVSTVVSVDVDCIDSGEALATDPTTDCNDGNAAVHPGATETCNGIDDNCVGGIDEGVKTTYYIDADTDTYGSLSGSTLACSVPVGYASSSNDCNDGNAAVHPGVTETCNGIDDNCVGGIDEGVKNTYYLDADSDTYGLLSGTTLACAAPGGYVSNSTDCNDGNSAVHPGATEACNGIDDNCVGGIDEGCPVSNWDTDLDGIPDTYEIAHASSSPPLNYLNGADGLLDSDTDGNPNVHEYWNGTDYRVKDPKGGEGCFFWGDATGDGFIGAVDITILTSRIKGPADYSRVIPNNGETQDLDDNGFWGAVDTTLLSAFAKSDSTTGIATRPSSIEKLSAATASVQVGNTTHVTVALRNLHSTYTVGFGVVFSIDPSSTGTAVILGGDGANGSGYRYDMTGAKSFSARSNVIILVKTAGTIKINAGIPQCGILVDLGRYCSALSMAEPFVITGY